LRTIVSQKMQKTRFSGRFFPLRLAPLVTGTPCIASAAKAYPVKAGMHTSLNFEKNIGNKSMALR
jgi:hypothetical protein